MERPVLRTIRFALKWLAIGGAVFIGVALLTYVVMARFVPDPLEGSELTRESVRSPEQPEGGARLPLKVPDARVPKTREDEGEAAAIALIPERQERPLPPQTVPPAAERELAAVTGRFLRAWEIVAPGEPQSVIAYRIAPTTAPSEVDVLAARREANDPSEVGNCATCTTSLTLTDEIDPALYMVVRRYAPESAYVTTQGVVVLGGGTSQLSGLRLRRSYALLLERQGEQWRVTRAVADTLGPSE